MERALHRFATQSWEDDDGQSKLRVDEVVFGRVFLRMWLLPSLSAIENLFRKKECRWRLQPAKGLHDGSFWNFHDASIW